MVRLLRKTKVSDRHNPDAMGIGRNEESLCNGYRVSVLQDKKKNSENLFYNNLKTT